MHESDQATRQTLRGCRQPLRVFPCICHFATVRLSTYWMCMLHKKNICRTPSHQHSPHAQCVVWIDNRRLDHIVTGARGVGSGFRSSFRLHIFEIKCKTVKPQVLKRDWHSSEDKWLKIRGSTVCQIQSFKMAIAGG